MKNVKSLFFPSQSKKKEFEEKFLRYKFLYQKLHPDGTVTAYYSVRKTDRKNYKNCEEQLALF